MEERAADASWALYVQFAPALEHESQLGFVPLQRCFRDLHLVQENPYFRPRASLGGFCGPPIVDVIE